MPVQIWDTCIWVSCSFLSVYDHWIFISLAIKWNQRQSALYKDRRKQSKFKAKIIGFFSHLIIGYNVIA